MKLSPNVYRFFVGGFSLLYLAALLQLVFGIALSWSSVYVLVAAYCCAGCANVLNLGKLPQPAIEYKTTIGLQLFPAIGGVVVVYLVGTKIPAALFPLTFLVSCFCIWFTGRLETYPLEAT